MGIFYLLSLVLNQILFSVYPNPNLFPNLASSVILNFFKKQNNTATESKFLSFVYLNYCIVAHCKLPVARDDYLLSSTVWYQSTQQYLAITVVFADEQGNKLRWTADLNIYCGLCFLDKLYFVLKENGNGNTTILDYIQTSPVQWTSPVAKRRSVFNSRKIQYVALSGRK